MLTSEKLMRSSSSMSWFHRARAWAEVPRRPSWAGKFCACSLSSWWLPRKREELGSSPQWFSRAVASCADVRVSSFSMSKILNSRPLYLERALSLSPRHFFLSFASCSSLGELGPGLGLEIGDLGLELADLVLLLVLPHGAVVVLGVDVLLGVAVLVLFLGAPVLFLGVRLSTADSPRARRKRTPPRRTCRRPCRPARPPGRCAGARMLRPRHAWGCRFACALKQRAARTPAPCALCRYAKGEARD